MLAIRIVIIRTVGLRESVWRPCDKLREISSLPKGNSLELSTVGLEDVVKTERFQVQLQAAMIAIIIVITTTSSSTTTTTTTTTTTNTISRPPPPPYQLCLLKWPI